MRRCWLEPSPRLHWGYRWRPSPSVRRGVPGHLQVRQLNTPYPIAVPWLNVAIALLVVPVVAVLGAGLLTRSRLPVERRL